MTFLLQVKSLAFTLFVAFALAGTAVTTSALVNPQPAEAGVLKKGKKVLKGVGKGARWVEKKAAKGGKFGKAVAKGARGLRKGTEKAARGLAKAQRAGKKAFGKVCKGNCRKVVKGVNKVRKGINHLKRDAERKCRQFGRDSKACRFARNALEFASPI